ncbi:MAG: magnesium-dependent phosphatase-1 [Infirmifilum sp.]
MRLLILDLDNTLWSHHDISRTEPPYRRISQDTIVDSMGETIKLNPCAAQVLSEAKNKGILLAVASWNNPEKAEEAIVALGLQGFFEEIVVEPHPYKEKMIRRILRKVGVKPSEAVFVDDNSEICRRVRGAYPELKVFNLGIDIQSLCELLHLIKQDDL